jgi:hypothetical protein
VFPGLQSLALALCVSLQLPPSAGTCEIFGASCLVLPSLKVTREAVFQSIAVTSEKWLPLAEVRALQSLCVRS